MTTHYNTKVLPEAKDVGFPDGASGKELPSQCRRLERLGFNRWVGKIPWRMAWQPTPVFLPGESHGQEEAGGLQSIGPQRVGHNWSDAAHTHVLKQRCEQ